MNVNVIPAIPADLVDVIAAQTARDQERIARGIEQGHAWPESHYDSKIAGLIGATMSHAFHAVNAEGEGRAYYLGMAAAYERMAREAIAAAEEA